MARKPNYAFDRREPDDTIKTAQSTSRERLTDGDP